MKTTRKNTIIKRGGNKMANYIKDIRKKVGHDAIFMPAVGAVIYENGKILLQKRQDDGKWATHGGAMELGETYLQTLERELKEEINIKPINPQLLGIYSGEKTYHEYPNKDKAYVVLTLFFVEKYEGTLKEDNDEVLELRWFDLDELPKNISNLDFERIKDIKEFLQNREVMIN